METHDVGGSLAAHPGTSSVDLWDIRIVEKLAALVPGTVCDEHKCFFGESDETNL